MSFPIFRLNRSRHRRQSRHRPCSRRSLARPRRLQGLRGGAEPRNARLPRRGLGRSGGALDVRSLDEVHRAAAAAADTTILINNAGVVGHMGENFTDPAWLDASRQEHEVNVVGTLAVTQAFAPVLARNGGGAVVNIASVASFAAFALIASYSASKAAVHSLTQTTRQSLKAQGTYVAGVYPGPIDTDMARDLPIAKTSPADAAEAILDGIEAGEEEIFPDPASRQMGEAFLASPKALERTVADGGLS